MSGRKDFDLAGMAPHTDPQWVEDFVIEQRLLGVLGTRIGDALATVDSHLEESGQSAQEAFGPAVEYARELAASEGGDDQDLDIGPGFVVGNMLGLVGIVALPRAVAALLEGTPVTITVGDVAASALLAALMTILLVAPSPVLRFLVHRPVLAVLLVPLLIGAMVGLFVALPTPLFAVPAVAIGILGLAAVAVSVAFAAREPVDLIEDPSGKTLGSAGRSRLLSIWVLPGATALMCLMTVMLWLLQ